MAVDSISRLLFFPAMQLYYLLQWILDIVLSPEAPKPGREIKGPKIAIVGAGLTGVAAASHCVGHGFDVTIFEKGEDDKSIGGIWTKVNNTSGLQINSIMYRFQPSVKWSEGYPKQGEIVGEIQKLWRRYDLQGKTKFSTTVDKVYKDDQGRWIVNDPSNGRFAAVIAAIGTCGDAKIPHVPGQDTYKGEIFHSSNLTGKSVKDKHVLIVGGGASAVEALEHCDTEGAAHINILARSEKWIIPRNVIVDALLSLNVFGQETLFSWIPEGLLRIFFYRDLRDIAPPEGSRKGIFTETPMVNSRVFELIRSGRASWLRGDIQGFEADGINFNHRSQGVPKGGPGREELIKGETTIMATGFKRPSLKFLPGEFFCEPYDPPNWYLQVFPPQDPSVCCNNCTYVSAIGTVGNYHIGIYTRFLLMFLTDPLTKPTERWMKRWIDMTRLLKRTAPGGAFDFFTYGELIYWFVFVIVINPFRWKWAMFVLFGIGSSLPRAIVDQEDALRETWGQDKSKSAPQKANGIKTE